MQYKNILVFLALPHIKFVHMSVKTIFDVFFTNVARRLVRTTNDGRYGEWVLFRHGSLYIQTMPKNEETSSDKLINQAKQNLSQVLIRPGTNYGDATTSTFNYENEELYYSCIETFAGLIMVHPSQIMTHPSKQAPKSLLAMMLARINVLNDKENPIVVTTGNTKQT